MAIKFIRRPDLVWIYIDQVDKEALEYLKSSFKFHHLDFKDLQSENQRPKLDTYNNYLFAVFHLPDIDKNKNLLTAAEMDVFLGDGYVITVPKKRYKPLREIFYRCLNNPKIKHDFFEKDSGYLIYKILDGLFVYSFNLLDLVSKEAKQLEDDIYAEETHNVVRELAEQRRNILNFRRTIEPQKLMMQTMASEKVPLIKQELSLYFDDLRDTLENTLMVIDNLHALTEGLYSTYESLINNRTNQTIKMLTVISVSLLPLTLLSGLYGMNLVRLPYAESPGVVWGIFLGLLAVILAVIYYFRNKHYL